MHDQIVIITSLVPASHLAQAGGSPSAQGWTGVAVGLVVAAVVVGVVVLGDRRRARESSARMSVERDMADAHQRREQATAEQHVELNRLAAHKMKLEIEMLEVQIQVSRKELESRVSMDKYHEVATEKAKKELEMLDAQTQLAKRDISMRHETHDYHDAMIEKAKLEIESLRLQIREQRKRLDEFGTFE